ncbi:MAG: hypothetical protein U0892_17490 [Pirellulales bacterium]
MAITANSNEPQSLAAKVEVSLIAARLAVMVQRGGALAAGRLRR